MFDQFLEPSHRANSKNFVKLSRTCGEIGSLEFKIYVLSGAVSIPRYIGIHHNCILVITAEYFEYKLLLNLQNGH